MNRWFTFFIERFSPITTLLVIMGISVCGLIISGGTFSSVSFTVSCLLLFYLSFLLRLQNDLRDYDTDRVAFPSRVLPRGVLHRKEVQKVISILQVGLILYLVFLFMMFGIQSKVFLVFSAGYYWLMQKNFFLGKSLDRRLLLKTAIQQGLIVPLFFLIVSFAETEKVFTQACLAYSLLIYGAFFTFEICRKLDPWSHPASQSLIHFFGFKKMYKVTVIMLILSAIGAYGLGVARYLIPCELVVFLTMTYLFKNPRRFFITELAASISLVVHSWSAIFALF